MSRSLFGRVLRACVLGCAAVIGTSLHAAEPPASSASSRQLAFYYGTRPPVDELRAFDQVVVQPNQLTPQEVQQLLASGPEIVAYISIGEVARNSVDWPKIDQRWVTGENRMWNSAVMDYSQAAWRRYLADEHFADLWAKGYRAFFLDTVDSYELVLPPVPAEWNAPGRAEKQAVQDRARELQEAGLEALLSEVKQRFPGVKLIFNRGFKVLPRVHRFADGFVAETLFAGYHANNREYFEETAERSQWLLGNLKQVQEKFGIPVTVIDYLPPGQTAKAEALAKRIRALGFGVWIANGDLNMLGQGIRRVMPRRLLALYDGAEPHPDHHPLNRSLAVLLEQEGWLLDWRHVEREPLPLETLAGRYAGVLAWLSSRSSGQQPGLCARLKTEAAANVRTLFFGQIPTGAACADWLGTVPTASAAQAPLKLTSADPSLAFGRFEAEPRLRLRELRAGTAPLGARVWLRLEDAKGQAFEPVFTAAFGGVALHPYLLDDRLASPTWLLNPLPLLRQALQLPVMPVADPMMENGRRIGVALIAADGFAAQAVDGRRNGEHLLEALKEWPHPLSLTVAEGELTGKDEADGETRRRLLQALAERPGTEILPHSFSHPFSWRAFEGDSKHAHVRNFYTLPQPGYLAELNREIVQPAVNMSARWPATRADVLVWPGDAEPGAAPLATATAAGLQTFGGGGLRHTGPKLSGADVGPLLRQTPWGTQIRAPLVDETTWSLLTQGEALNGRRLLDWNRQTWGPAAPGPNEVAVKRHKPWWLYWQADAWSRPGAAALFADLREAAGRESLVWLSLGEWLERVRGFQHAVLARELDGSWWLDARGLRSLRVPDVMGWPQLGETAVAGGAETAAGRSLMLSAGTTPLRLRFAALFEDAPQLQSASQPLQRFSRTSDGLTLQLRGGASAEVQIRQPRACRLLSADEPLPGRHRDGVSTYSLNAAQAAAELRLDCSP